MQKYIYTLPDWPNFRWQDSAILVPLANVRHKQGRIMGIMAALGFDYQSQTLLHTLSQEVIQSHAIEGESLDGAQVRSSVARRLGLETAGLPTPTHRIDAAVDLILDAVQHYTEPLTAERLFAWHAALFPVGYSGLSRIAVGTWRTDSTGVMQVVSGAIGCEQVHFQAPPAAAVPAEMARFLAWLNAQNVPNETQDSVQIDGVLKAAVAHLWFLTIHPFEDGNGRIARAITELLLARADDSALRFYSMSHQIHYSRNAYYTVLEHTQKGDLDITQWLLWFLDSLDQTLTHTETVVQKILHKAQFWQRNRHHSLNDRQRKMLNMLLDDFEGNLTTAKWAKIAKCSTDTALRDIQDLIHKGILVLAPASGRNTHYLLNG